MTPEQRKIFQSVQSYLVHKSGQVGYDQLRPMQTRDIATFDELKGLFVRAAGGLAIDPDCSETFTLMCHIVGAKSPTGYSYGSGLGNTETIAAYLDHHYTDARLALPGAAILFDLDQPLPEQHIASVHIADPHHGNPIVFNHGGPGCQFMPLSWLEPAFVDAPIFASVADL